MRIFVYALESDNSACTGFADAVFDLIHSIAIFFTDIAWLRMANFELH
jgi:hypothetical protein